MHMQGAPIAVISQWLGHADLAFTMRTYVHARDGALRAAADTLQRVVTVSCQRTGLRTSVQPGAFGFPQLDGAFCGASCQD